MYYINHAVTDMVGYQKNDSITSTQKFIAGCVSGCTTRFITQPLDVLKVRIQLQKKKKSFHKTTVKILKKEGIRTFWYGHNLGQIHSVLSISTLFYAYEVATKYAATINPDSHYEEIQHFICGMFAGTCSATLVIPIEVIRVRQIVAQSQYKGFMKGAKEVYKSGGILSFYGGLGASILQMGPQSGISFGVFSFLQPLILNTLSKPCDGTNCKHAAGNTHRPEVLVAASTIAASVAGFVSKSLTYPFDLAKRRLQIASHKEDEQYQVPSTTKKLRRCRSLTQCITSTVRKEGFLGLYRGWNVTIYKAQLTSVVSYTTYEFVCYLIREI